MLLFIIHFVRQKYFENGLSQQLFCICLKYPSLVILFLTVLYINVKASGVIFSYAVHKNVMRYTFIDKGPLPPGISDSLAEIGITITRVSFFYHIVNSDF